MLASEKDQNCLNQFKCKTPFYQRCFDRQADFLAIGAFGILE
jgi:hypothetical protein